MLISDNNHHIMRSNQSAITSAVTNDVLILDLFTLVEIRNRFKNVI